MKNQITLNNYNSKFDYCSAYVIYNTFTVERFLFCRDFSTIDTDMLSGKITEFEKTRVKIYWNQSLKYRKKILMNLSKLINEF